MKRILFLALIVSVLSLGTVAAAAQDVARGSVYHDVNANGRRDRGEPWLEDVAVSNGREVVLTDEKGRYSLPISNDQIVFVIKPAAYNYPVDEQNKPLFYYNHKPEGSPALKYPGVAPTGPLPESIDFGLLSGSAADTFSIVVLSDPQPYHIEEVGFYDKAIVEELKGLKDLAFGITLGDLVGDRPDFFEPLNAATARVGLPWFHVMGNHDKNFDAERPELADESFERVYGPATYAFNQGKVHFIVLDDVIYPNAHSNAQYIGGLREEHFQFIEQSLKYVPSDHLVVLNMHIPLYNERSDREAFLNAHRARLFALLEGRPFTLSMSGHTHTQRHYFFGEEEGWKNPAPHHHYTVGTAGGDWWSGVPDENGVPDAVMRDGTPKGYNVLHFEGNQYTYDYRVAGASADYKMRIYGPRVIPHNGRYRGELFVNFFQGDAETRVEYRINNSGEWRAMNRVVEQDPHISRIRAEWDSAAEVLPGVRPSNPVSSHHLWKVRITTRLPLGKNTYNIRVSDRFGRVYHDSYELEAVE